MENDPGEPLLKPLAISIIAFLSGVLSLVSQIAGLRIATQEVGAAPITVATILASALLGLSLGAVFLGSVVDRLRQNRIVAAGLLAFASALLLLLAWLGRPFAQWLITLQLPLAIESAIFAATAVLPINICLGGVIPGLAQANSTSGASNFGWIYGLETLGASVGAIMLAMWLLPQYGLNQSLAVIGLVACLVASVVFQRVGWSSSEQQEIDGKQRVDNGSSRVRGQWLVLIAVFLCSFASLGMELVWQRWFSIAFGSDSQSYAVVAATFLIGVSLGAVSVNRFSRRWKAAWGLQSYGILVFAIGVSLAISLSLLRAGFKTQTLQSSLTWMVENPLTSRVVLAAAVVCLPAILIGAAFSLVVQYWQRIQGAVMLGTSTGKIYGVAILGNVIGVLLCGFVLIPNFGLKNTAVLFAVAMQVLGGATLLVNWMFARKVEAGSSLRIPFVVSILLICSLCTWQVHRESFFAGVVDESGWQVLQQWERASHTVTVIKSRENKKHRQLLIDGVNVGESYGGVDEKQQMLAHLPFLVREHKQANVLTIGLGTGILAGELVQNESVNAVTCVELSNSVIKAAEFFSAANQEVLKSSKLNLVPGDGMRYLKVTDRTYDIVVSDGKTRPGAASNLPFFTREYYQNCASRLSDSGVFAQWVSLHCDRREIETILASFAGAFPNGYLAFSPPDSVYLIGTKQPLIFSSEELDTKISQAKGLGNYFWRSADDILAMYWMSDSRIREAFPKVVTNSLDLQALERYSWSSYNHSVTSLPPQMAVLEELVKVAADSPQDKPNVLSDDDGADKLKSARAGSRAWLEAEQLIATREDDDWLDQATQRFKEALQLLPQLNRQWKFADLYRGLASEARKEKDNSTEYAALQAVRKLKMATADDELRMGDLLKSQGMIGRAVDHYYKAVKESGNDPVCRLAFGDALLRIGKFRQAISQLTPVTQIADSEPGAKRLKAHAALLLGVAEIRLGRIDVGQQRIQASLNAFPDLESLIPSG